MVARSAAGILAARGRTSTATAAAAAAEAAAATLVAAGAVHEICIRPKSG